MKIIEDLALRPEAILKLLGRESADSAVISMLRNHGANRYRPSLDEEDPDVMTDWFPVPDLGIEFGFKDEAFLKGWDPLGRRACPLIFHELIYYGSHSKMSAFVGELPFGLLLSDKKSIVQKKMAQLECRTRSYKRDVWELPEYRVVVTYLPDESSIADLIVYLPDAPWQLPGIAVPKWPDFESIISLFGKSPDNIEFQLLFRVFGVLYQLDELDGGYIIDLNEEFGFELHFSKAAITSPRQRQIRKVLSGIVMHRERDIEARAWSGTLPFEIVWDDSPTVVLEKVGMQPTKQPENSMSGSMFWDFTKFSLQVMYSMLDNLVYRVTISLPKELP